MKNIDDHFADWEGDTFGYGYGSGEEHVLGAIKTFLGALEERRSYDYRVLEAALTPPTAWLLLNALARADMIEYGTSPRFGWLTRKGEALRDYFEAKTLDEIVEQANRDHEYLHCYKDWCNCDDGDCRPHNPFWTETSVYEALSMDMYTEQAGVAMAIQKEDAVRAELGKRFPGLPLVDLAKRCGLVRYSGDPREHLLLDGKAIMAFHPLESELVQEGDVYKYRVSQKFETF